MLRDESLRSHPISVGEFFFIALNWPTSVIVECISIRSYFVSRCVHDVCMCMCVRVCVYACVGGGGLGI